MNDYIRIIQERELVSFEEAQYYLRKANGSVDLAIQLIQKRKRSFWYRFSENTRNAIQSFWKYRIMICREDRLFLNISFSIFILIVWLINFTGIQLVWLLFLLVLFVIASGSEISLVKIEQTDNRIHKMEEKQMQSYASELENAVESTEEAELLSERPAEAEKAAEPKGKAEQSLHTSLQPNLPENELDGYSEIIIK